MDNFSNDSNDNYIKCKSIRCTECGQSVMNFGDNDVDFCVYCGSTSVKATDFKYKPNMDYIIPFECTKEKAIRRYVSKLNRFILAPEYFKKKSQLSKIRSVYVPFEIRSYSKNGLTKTNEFHIKTATIGDYNYYDSYAAEADVDISYECSAFDLSKRYDNCLNAAIPFNIDKKEVFNSDYLQDHFVAFKDGSSVPSQAKFALDNMFYGTKPKDNSLVHRSNYYSRVEKDLKNRIGSCEAVKFDPELRKFKRKLNLRLDTVYNYGLFPVYFLATRDKKDKNIYSTVINGQTGKVACNLPVGYIKLFVFSLLLTIGFYLGLRDFYLHMYPVLLITLFISTITYFISKNQAKKICVKEYFEYNKKIDINVGKLCGVISFIIAFFDFCRWLICVYKIIIPIPKSYSCDGRIYIYSISEVSL